MRKLSAFILVCSLVLGVAPLYTKADQVSDLQTKIQDTQKQRDALLQERQKIQAELDQAQTQGKTLQSTVNQLEASRKKIDTDLKVTQSSITSANLTIEKLALTITEKENQIGTHRQAIAESMRRLSDFDGGNLLSNLLAKGTIATIWEDKESLDTIQDTLQTEIGALRETEANLSKEKSEKEQTKTKLGSLQKELSGQKQTVETTKAAQAKLLAATKSQEAAYQKLLADNIAREKQFEAALFAYESALKVAIDPSKLPTVAHSVLSWPLDKVKITQQFGKTSSSGRLYASGTHNGVDFGTPVGSAVRAVRQGVITAMGNTDDAKSCYSYGRWILIQHDNGLSSIYGHLSSAIVSPGQSVKAGDIIGYSGGVPGAYGSGYSTGPHLHLGLYATQAVKVQIYANSINCKNVSIPIAPPDGYLDPLAYMPSL